MSSWSASRPAGDAFPRPAADCRWWRSTARPVIEADGPVPFLDLFQGHDELVIYHHMWHDGVPHQGQCAGCTFNVWQMKDTVYLKARGVSFAVLTSGRWDEVAPFIAFMGYAQPWYSVRGVEAPIATDEGHIVCYLRDGDRAFLTYRTTGRGRARRRIRRPAGHDATVGARRGKTTPRAGPRDTTLAGTGLQTRTGTPPGARPAAPRRSGPARARPPVEGPGQQG